MRKPQTIEKLYLDFDSFFASVEQQARPSLRGRPIGVVPFAGTDHTCVIACSREAKARGVQNVMKIRDARRVCPDIELVPQSPDLYRRAHNALLSEIASVIPVTAIKSIDELTCDLEPRDIADPHGLAAQIKGRLHEHIGPYITCSIGFAASRQLAKIACKMDKPDGVTIWHPEDMPGPLLGVPFEDIPGIGRRMEKRLMRAGIFTINELLKLQPKRMRKLWGNVTGEKLWYALQGYDVKAGAQSRGMYGHGRVLPPEARSLDDAYSFSRLLLIKAARRMRRDRFYAGRLWLWLSMRDARWFGEVRLPIVRDDQACLDGLMRLWARARRELPGHAKIIRMGVTLLDLWPGHARQLDIFLRDDAARLKWEKITTAVDHINTRHGKTLVSLGPWTPPPGGNAGGKISYVRIPSAEDFW